MIGRRSSLGWAGRAPTRSAGAPRRAQIGELASAREWRQCRACSRRGTSRSTRHPATTAHSSAFPAPVLFAARLSATTSMHCHHHHHHHHHHQPVVAPASLISSWRSTPKRRFSPAVRHLLRSKNRRRRHRAAAPAPPSSSSAPCPCPCRQKQKQKQQQCQAP